MTTEAAAAGSTPDANAAPPAAAADQAAAGGRATLGDGATGTPAEGAAPSTAGGGGEASSDAFAGLDTDTRKAVDSKGYKTVADLAKAYVHAESRLGSAVTVPGPDASAEERAAFFAKAGRPETAAEYQFTMPEGVPEGVYNQDFAETFKQMAHGANLTKDQADAVHGAYTAYAVQQHQAFAQAMERRADEATAALVKDWGPADSQVFQRNTEMAARAVRNLGGEELRAELRGLGFINQHGDILSPLLAKALAKVGSSLYAEDTMFGTAAQGQANPFAKATRNEDEVGRLIRDARGNPSKTQAVIARIRSAGENPAEFGFEGH